jgi:PAS domain S-box-containing protein
METEKLLLLHPQSRRIGRLDEKLRKSGIDIIGDIPWGTHFCQFFQTKEDLMDILVSYFKAGLENNEVCLWITSQPVEVEEAKEALRKAVPDFDTYLENGQIEFIPYAYSNLKDGNLDSENTSKGWVEKLNQALTDGYEGLRLAENTFWLEKNDWNDFADHEEEIDRIIENYQMMVLCTYFLDRCDTTKITDVILSHQFALIKRKGKWEQIENSKRKKTEDKIQTLANIMEPLEDAVITKSLDGIITSWNKGAEQIYGYLAEEILGKSISILEPALLVEETKELVELIKQKDKIHHFETLRLRKDGKIVNVSLTLSPIFDNSENIITILVIARDITLRKKAVEELKKSEERYRIVTEQTGHVIYDYDSRTGKCIWAGAIEEVTGYSSEELQTFGKNFWVNNIHCEVTNLVSKKFLDVRTTEGRFKEELRLRRKDGTRIYIEHNGVSFTDHEGQLYGAVGILKDITSIKIAGIQLQESENSFAEAQRISHIGNWDWNIITDEVYLSDETYRIFELGPQEFGATYNAFLSHVHQEDRDYFDDTIKKALNGEPHSIDYRIILPNGKERDVHIESKVISDENNIPTRMKGTVQDITERKKAEEALRLSNIYNRSLIEASLDPLVTIGHDGKITDVNISTEFVTGYSRD